MTFRDLSPAERVQEVERFLLPEPELPSLTREALHRAKLAWVSELAPEALEAERQAWLEHLGRLRAADADEAEHELRKFIPVLAWLRVAEPEEVEAER